MIDDLIVLLCLFGPLWAITLGWALARWLWGRR